LLSMDNRSEEHGRTHRCRRWAAGFCHLAEKCTLQHSGDPGVYAPCRNFLAGACAYGTSCDFKHDYSQLGPEPKTIPTPSEEKGWNSPGSVAAAVVEGHGSAAVERRGPIGGTERQGPAAREEQGTAIVERQETAGDGQERQSATPVEGNDSTPLAVEKSPEPWSVERLDRKTSVGEIVRRGPTVPCRHFEKGHCRKGPSCSFLHAGQPSPAVPRIRRQCRHFAKGLCHLGSACGFAHGDADHEQRPVVLTRPVNPVQKSSTSPCRHFEKGYCRLGPLCNFAHESALGGSAY